MSNSNDNDNIKEILSLVKKEAIFSGFSNDTLRYVSEAFSGKPYYIEALIGDITDVISLIITDVDEKSAENIKTIEGFSEYSKGKAIEHLVNFRLEYFGQDLSRQLVKFFMLPKNFNFLLKILWRSSDNMWKLVENNPADGSFYSKRVILAMLYSSTIAVHINDNSEGKFNTVNFLKNRIKNIGTVAKIKHYINNNLC